MNTRASLLRSCSLDYESAQRKKFSQEAGVERGRGITDLLRSYAWVDEFEPEDELEEEKLLATRALERKDSDDLSLSSPSLRPSRAATTSAIEPPNLDRADSLSERPQYGLMSHKIGNVDLRSPLHELPEPPHLRASIGPSSFVRRSSTSYDGASFFTRKKSPRRKKSTRKLRSGKLSDSSSSDYDSPPTPLTEVEKYSAFGGSSAGLPQSDSEHESILYGLDRSSEDHPDVGYLTKLIVLYYLFLYL